MRKFLQPQFDELEFANSVIESGAVEAVLEKLTRGVGELDREIKRQVSSLCPWSTTRAAGDAHGAWCESASFVQVSDNYEGLLGHLNFAQKLQQSVSGVRTGVTSLQLQVNQYARWLASASRV